LVRPHGRTLFFAVDQTDDFPSIAPVGSTVRGVARHPVERRIVHLSSDDPKLRRKIHDAAEEGQASNTTGLSHRQD
jgi:hypothetical protein